MGTDYRISAIGQDLRHAARSLRRSPGFTLFAVLAVALGIGANTLVFSVVNAVLLRPLPYRDPQSLFALRSRNLPRAVPDKVTSADFWEWQSRSKVFEQMGCYWDASRTITGTAQTESLIGWAFSSNVFSLLGTPPLLGRTFTADDALPGGVFSSDGSALPRDPVVILSHKLWQRRFDGDPGIVGRTLQLDRRDYTIIGVMPPGFTYPYGSTEVWTPMVTGPEFFENRRLHALQVVGRARGGVSRVQAQREMDAIARRLAAEHPDTNGAWGIEVLPIRHLFVGDLQTTLLILQAAVLFMLLISCANVANLVLARASGRAREVAVRLALGAGRVHLFRQFFTEGMLIALLGAAGGLVAASWGVRVLPALFAEQLGRLLEPVGAAGLIDRTVLLWTSAVTVMVGFLFGAAPMSRPTGTLLASLKAGGRGSSDGAGAARLRGVLVATQVAFALVLLVGAGLLARSFVRLHGRSFGFRTDAVVVAFLSLPANRPGGLPARVALLEQLEAQVRALPGVESVGLISTVPLSGNNARRRYRAPGRAETPNIETDLAEFRVASPGYFRVMGPALEQGRLFDERDRAGGAEVVVVNATLARRLWPNESAVGKGLVVPDAGTPALREVVGVVADTRHSGLAIEPVAEVYRPAYQAAWPFVGLVVRSAPDAPGLAGALRRAVGSVDAEIPVGAVRTMEELAADSVALRRSSTIVLALFGGVSLLLASFGVYSVIAYAVTQRTREIGLRIALGASPRAVVGSIVREGFGLATSGLGVGLALAMAVTRYLSHLLFGISPLDAATLAAAALVVLAVALLAALLPALSAARLDPALTLRSE